MTFLIGLLPVFLALGIGRYFNRPWWHGFIAAFFGWFGVGAMVIMRRQKIKNWITLAPPVSRRDGFYPDPYNRAFQRYFQSYWWTTQIRNLDGKKGRNDPFHN